MTSINILFELVHINDVFRDDIVEEVDIKEVLKSSIFVVQKATAPKIGVEFRQGSIGAIRSSLATSYGVWRRRAASPAEDRIHPGDTTTHTPHTTQTESNIELGFPN